MIKVKLFNSDNFESLQYLVNNWFNSMSEKSYSIVNISQSESMTVGSNIHRSYSLTIVYREF